MKRGLRLIAFLTVSTLALAGFAACGKADTQTSSEPTKAAEATKAPEATKAAEVKEETPTVQDVALKVWAPQEEQEILKQMTARFQELHPEYNLTFEYGVVSEGDAANELQKDAQAGADVFAFASDQTSRLVESGILYPITKNAEEVKIANSQASISAATVDNQLYAYPFTPNSWFMYYDKSKYSEADIASLETMMAKDLGDGVQNFSVDIDNSWYISSFFFAGGSTLFGADGRDATSCTFNDANGVSVANYLVDLVANPKFLDEVDGNMINAFKDGKLGAACSGTWNAGAIQEALGDNYGAAKLPTINLNGQDKQLSNFADFKLIGVNFQTKHPIPAMELAEFLAGEECQKLRFEARSIAPTNLKLATDPVVLTNPAVAALSLQTSFSTLQSSIPQMGNYWTPAEAFGDALLSGEVTKENAQSKLDEMVASILSSIG